MKNKPEESITSNENVCQWGLLYNKRNDEEGRGGERNTS